MQNVMIDIEALSKRTDAVIVSLAAVEFDPLTGATGNSLYLRADIESSEAAGGRIDASTVKWWMRQSAEVRAEILSFQKHPIDVVLRSLNEFLGFCADSSCVKLWARGTDYDFPIIYSAMARLGITPAWRFWNVRDVRSVEESALILIGFAAPRHQVTGEFHNALNDCHSQVMQVSENMQLIRNRFAIEYLVEAEITDADEGEGDK